MKNFLLFIVLISLIGCSSIKKQLKNTAIIECPSVYFSSENSIYLSGDIESNDLEKINYKASLNNYAFSNDCNSNLKTKNFNLDILIIAEPLNPKDEKIKLPIFVLQYDRSGKVIGRQYFKSEDIFEFNKVTQLYESKEIIENLNISYFGENSVAYLTIGFVNLK